MISFRTKSALALCALLVCAPAAAASDVTYRCGQDFANLCRIDVATKKVTRLTHDGQPETGPRYRDVSVSRSGRRHAFVFGNDLYISGRTPTRAGGPTAAGVVFG